MTGLVWLDVAGLAALAVAPTAAELRQRHERAWADFDDKYRRCEQHNRARYWCGCYYAAAPPVTDTEAGRDA